MASFLLRKLQHHAQLSREECAVLEDLAGRRVRILRPREDLIRQGEPPGALNLVLDGFACRYKLLPDGRRQVVAFFLPGDLCDLHAFILRNMDHSISALAVSRVAQIPPEEMDAAATRFPRISRALFWNTLTDQAILREWTVNLGQRTGIERVAHLLCELFHRLAAIGLVRDDACPFPIAQSDLSDALGISIVHTNRMLQELRSEGLIVLRNRLLHVPDLPALQVVASFDPGYLHLDEGVRRLYAELPTAALGSAAGDLG